MCGVTAALLLMSQICTSLQCQDPDTAMLVTFALLNADMQILHCIRDQNVLRAFLCRSKTPPGYA